MSQTRFELLDDLLARSDPDRSDFWDGCEHDLGGQHLQRFKQDDWCRLEEEFPHKTVNWNRCLVGILVPPMGKIAQSILLALADRNDDELAFDAMRAIEFHCGVNRGVDFGAEGKFIDESILDREFLSQVRGNERFKSALGRMDGKYGNEYKLLRSMIES